MSKYKSREEAFKAFCETPTNEWHAWVESLAVEAHTIKYPLYHLSFNGNNPGIWSSSNPSAKSTKLPKPTGIYTEILCEILPNGVCTSSTYEGCWFGIYPNVRKLFENKSQHHDVGTVFCYVAKPSPRTLVLTPEVMNEEFLVWDAFYSKEHRILGDCKMELDSFLTFKNTADYSNTKQQRVYPFNDEVLGQTVKGYVPPFEIVELRPIKNKRNSKMSIYSAESFNMDKGGLTITVSNESIMRTLSQEMSLRPIAKLDSFVTDKFLSLLGRLNNFNVIKQAIPFTGSRLDVQKLNINDASTAVKKTDYMSLMGRTLDVPGGFKGPYTPYANLILDNLNLFSDVVDDVTRPCVAALQIILSNPDKLVSATASVLNGVENKVVQQTEFQGQLPNYFEVNSTTTQATYGQLFSNNADFLVAARKAKDIEVKLTDKQTFKRVSDIERDIDLISDLIDRLIVRIKQDQVNYAVNARMAVEIAESIERVAETVTFYAALLHMAEECQGIMCLATKKLK